MRTSYSAFTLTMALAMAVVGCSDVANKPSTKGHPHDSDAHPSEGPHGGDLIELGNEEYHAEILHDADADTVTIYVLDDAAAEQVPIDAIEITINGKFNGTAKQFKLAASPDAQDPPGKSSRFISDDKDLAHGLDEQGVEPILVLTINQKSYRGTISHQD